MAKKTITTCDFCRSDYAAQIPVVTINGVSMDFCDECLTGSKLATLGAAVRMAGARAKEIEQKNIESLSDMVRRGVMTTPRACPRGVACKGCGYCKTVGLEEAIRLGQGGPNPSGNVASEWDVPRVWPDVWPMRQK